MRHGLRGAALTGCLAAVFMLASATALAASQQNGRHGAPADGTPTRAKAAAWSAVSGPSAGPARSIGGYAAGCLSGGVSLPPEGAGYQVIRLSRKRNFGHPALIAFLGDFGRRVRAAGLGTALVADMGQARGGPMPFGHASHQIGLDADIWLRLDLPPLSAAARERLQEINFVDYGVGRVRDEVWTERQATLIRLAAEDSRVARLFVHPAIKLALCEHGWPDRSWLRKVRPWWGHDGHMHIRLSCPAGSEQCDSQAALPPGDGCDDDLHNWIAAANRPPVERAPGEAKPPRPVLPAACSAVLRAPAPKTTTLANRTAGPPYMAD